jgi:amidase
VEVVDSAIARIKAHNATINALIVFGFDDAPKAAKAAEAAIIRGGAVGPWRSVPIANFRNTEQNGLPHAARLKLPAC